MKTFSTIFLLTILSIVSAQNSTWKNFTSTKLIYDLTADGDKIWASTTGGCVTIDQNTGAKEHFNRSNTGLVDNFITSMQIESSGNKWFQVHTRGTAMFDGINWTSYNHSNSGIPDDNVTSFREDLVGNVWMISINLNSLLKFDGTNWTTYNSYNSTLPSGYLGKFEFDNAGIMWMQTYGGGLVRFDGINSTVFNTTNSQIPSDTISDIAFDSTGNLWMSFANSGISMFDGAIWYNYNTANSNIPSNRVRNLVIQNNDVWAIYREQNDGLLKFDGNNWTDFNANNSSLLGGELYSLEISSNGDKWMVNNWNNNLKLIQFNDIDVIYHDISNSPLGGSTIFDIDIDLDGKIWAANSGEHIFKGQLISYQNNNWDTTRHETVVTWVTIQNDSTKWIGMYNRIGRIINGNTEILNSQNSGLFSNGVSNSVVDSHGNMWFATLGGLTKFDGLNWSTYLPFNSSFPSIYSYGLAIDSLDQIWLSSESEGLFMFDGINWTNYKVSNSGILTDFLTNLKFDRLGNLWIGSNDYGLMKFDGVNWFNYNTSNSLIPSNHVVTMGFDPQNNLWVGTQDGAAFYDGANWSLFTTTNSGIPHNSIFDFEFDSDGNVWIATNGGGMGVYNPLGVTLDVDKDMFGKKEIQLSVYPNPFQEDFVVEIEQKYVGSSFYVYDLNGRLISETELRKVKNTIDQSENMDGIYYFKVIYNSELISSGKLIKKL